MKRLADYDAFTGAFIRQLDPKVREGLSPEQWEAILDALRGSSPQRRHAIDLRGVISLYFARYYFVILAGRDRRIYTQIVECERRQQAVFAAKLVFLAIILSPVILVILVFFYLLKSSLGIDLFPGRHMGKYFGM